MSASLLLVSHPYHRAVGPSTSFDVVDLLRWALFTLGFVYLTTESVIFSPIRVALARRALLLETLLYCPACSGFWLGLLTSWAWPGETSWWLRLVESAVAGLALGALWGAAHSNPMWAAEAPLRDPTTQGEEREEDHG
jgi:hypothetical protein